MAIMRLKTLVIILFVVGGSAYLAAATYTTADCSRSAFQAAANSASDGDTVQGPLAGGSATWTTSLTTTKSLIINGNGCAITLSSTDGIQMLSTNASVYPRITNFTFGGKDGQAAVRIDGSNPHFRVDHNTFADLSVRSIVINYGGVVGSATQAYGVIDHNTIHNVSGYAAINVYGHNDTWFSDTNYGTSSAVYVEDNTITWASGTASPSQTAVDCEHGGRVVVRFNTITDGTIGLHDTGSSPKSRSCRIFERYNNTFHNDVNDSNADSVLSYRGGTGMDFNNSIPI